VNNSPFFSKQQKAARKGGFLRFAASKTPGGRLQKLKTKNRPGRDGFLRYEGWSWNSDEKDGTRKKSAVKNTVQKSFSPCYVVALISIS